MPPSDQEPRYQLVDSNGNVVGSLFGDGTGNVVIADETDTQTTFDANGITTPALEAGDLKTERTWNNVTSSRSFDTTETNTTDSEIIVAATAEATSDGTTVAITPELEGNADLRPNAYRDTIDGGQTASVMFRVGSGSDYRIISFQDTASYTLQFWMEFRP